MIKRKRVFVAAIVSLAALSVYPIFVLAFTWWHVSQSDLPGGRNGPLDAYRHSLASAVVGHTLSPKAVDWVTRLMEISDTAPNEMDRHNNLIGAELGTRAESFSKIEPQVRQLVLAGQVNATDQDRIRWLPKESWEDGWLW
ncbi:MAG: hypothetical protein IPN69_13800 [Acidobacteria bacterium]|nr:hypothetical protein [Acidobacteriota bacterium]